ncbi:metalloregulator ArsR/SmtB family transcription factor [Actinoallomurus purpureus]|uniref:ArsR/SmtB family transcription factor n=1 Tax=Actinoallomurus purpureus TaxID=478114 RepID=UPI0020935B49|nr:metalloregulator ArsR/SmtB family transcription factor [Actinoallomurus purpureus]MCO6008292.1 metalloregulator ArsR/SmtB family transcription factor [Actinoallomurus purpureus]
MTEDDDPVFKALADPTRRALLDRLLIRDGQSLTDLESQTQMSRFGVAKHLKVLEEAGIVVTHRQGREKLHFLNPIPIQLLYDRWIDKYTRQRATALADLKTALERTTMTATNPDAAGTTQVFRIHIKATPQAIWEAITTPEWTARYGYHIPATYELHPGGRYIAHANEGMKAMGTPDVVSDGEVTEAQPPHRLVQTFKMHFEDSQTAEPYTTLTWQIEAIDEHVSRLTVIHDVAGAPIHAALLSGDQLEGAGGGWPFILSDLKTLLETSTALSAGQP